MTQFSEKDLKAIRKLSEDIIGDGKNVREGMISAYLGHLPEKERNQGELMADRIYKMVDAYEEAFGEAKENPQKWLDETLDRFVSDKSTEDACAAYYKMVSDIADVAEAAGVENAGQVLEKAKSIYSPGKEASGETLKELKEILEEMVLHNGALFQKLTEQLGEYAAESAEGEMGDYSYDPGKERDLKAGMSMAAYILAKEGRFEDVPEDVTVDAITLMACAEYESIKIIEDAENGRITWDVAKVILEIAGCVALVLLCIAAIEFGVGLMAILLGSSVLGTILVTILSAVMVFAIAYWLVKYGVKITEDLADDFVEDIAKPFSEKVGKCATFSFRLFKAGLKRLKEFGEEAVERARAFADRVLDEDDYMTEDEILSEEDVDETIEEDDVVMA